MKNAKLLIINTAVLTLSSFLMKTISVSFNIYLTNRIGSSGMGLFQLIIAVYGLAVTFASAGIKLGATRLVTDSLSQNKKDTNRIMLMCIRYAIAIGTSISVIMYLFSGIISRKWIFDPRAEKSIKILSLSLSPISVSAALSGYFTARKNIVKYSTVQLGEQLVRIAVTVISLKLCGNTGLDSACSAVAVGMTAAEIISAFSSYLLYRNDSIKLKSDKKTELELKALLRISLPDAVGAGFRSVLLTIEHLLIPKGFEKSGQSTAESISIYGTIHGIALPVILYPSAVMSSLSSLLIPEFARLKLFNEKIKISYMASQIIKLSLIFSIGVGCYFFVFSQTVSSAIYKSDESYYYIKLLSVLIPVMYTDMITDGLLKGLDRQADSMRYNIFDSALCVLLVYFILPVYAIKGYIFILFLSEIINFALSINKLSKETQIKLNISNDIIKPLFFGFLCCNAVKILLKYTFFNTFNPKIFLIISVILCSFSFFSCISLSDCISKNELKEYSSLIKNKSYA
ncbi:MAG: oligosaccharide flippase family protein [Clostridia bacterium]|nr:oligosaccharide flippase family protein [Clostridia bacterium]